MPNAGYGSNRKTKHRLPNGFYKFTVNHAKVPYMLYYYYVIIFFKTLCSCIAHREFLKNILAHREFLKKNSLWAIPVESFKKLISAHREFLNEILAKDISGRD